MSCVHLCTTMWFSLLCASLAHERSWPDKVELQCLSSLDLHFPSCIIIVDGIFVKLRKPWIMLTLRSGLMVRRRCIVWTTQLWCPTKVSSFNWTWVFHVPSMMLRFSATTISIGFGVHISLMMTDILNTSLKILATSAIYGNMERPPDIDEGALTAYNNMHANYRVRA